MEIQVAVVNGLFEKIKFQFLIANFINISICLFDNIVLYFGLLMLGFKLIKN